MMSEGRMHLLKNATKYSASLRIRSATTERGWRRCPTSQKTTNRAMTRNG